MSAETTIVVGAGVAGLGCARALASHGRPVRILDKSRGVGGRCATRRVDGQPVDHGVAFFHGRDPAFLAALAEVPGGTPIAGWPARVRGTGHPCQPAAFAPDEVRLAFREGMSVFPKHLAAGLPVDLEARVASIEHRGDRLALSIEERGEVLCRRLVLSLPLEQARDLLHGIGESGPDARSLLYLLSLMSSIPCLTLIAGYEPGTGPPDWDVCYPDDSPVLQLASHDSSKRDAPRWQVIVYQALAAWSRAHLEDPAERWSAEILAEAARRFGAWAGGPAWTQAHRWRYARVDRGSELSGPALLRLPGGCSVGLAGEVFAPAGGVEAAFLSGERLAARLLGED